MIPRTGSSFANGGDVNGDAYFFEKIIANGTVELNTKLVGKQE